jgi:hypothetical protein
MKFTFLTLIAIVSFSMPAALAQTMQFDSNIGSELKQQVLDDFQFLQTIQGIKASPIHQQTFGAVDGANYAQWFNSRVFYFGYNNCGGGAAVACVKPQYHNKIWVTRNYTGIDHPQIARLMTVFHEARHTEDANNNWPHARCPDDFAPTSIWTGASLNGSYACDSTAYGSYSSASVMLNNVSKFCTNCSDKVKADAKLYSDDQVKRVIDPASIAALAADFAY